MFGVGAKEFVLRGDLSVGWLVNVVNRLEINCKRQEEVGVEKWVETVTDQKMIPLAHFICLSVKILVIESKCVVQSDSYLGEYCIKMKTVN